MAPVLTARLTENGSIPNTSIHSLSSLRIETTRSGDRTTSANGELVASRSAWLRACSSATLVKTGIPAASSAPFLLPNQIPCSFNESGIFPRISAQGDGTSAVDWGCWSGVDVGAIKIGVTTRGPPTGGSGVGSDEEQAAMATARASTIPNRLTPVTSRENCLAIGFTY